MDYLWHDHDTHISISVKTEEEPSSVGLHRASPAKVDVQEDKVEEEVTEEDAEIAETNTAHTNMESYGTCAVALYDYEVNHWYFIGVFRYKKGYKVTLTFVMYLL